MQRIEALRSMIRERRLGFQIDEVMSGTHEFEPGCGPRGTFPFEFRVSWGPKDITHWANPRDPEFLCQPLWGRVSIGGLCDDLPCEGSLKLRYFSKRTIRYRFDFTSDGKTYRYLGEKVNILPWNLPTSHTTCFGTVVDRSNGVLVSRSVTHFRLKTAFDFVTSFRLA
jgi:hypothetical protein